MGSDVYYHCPVATRDSVERLVELIAKWAEENSVRYQKVALANRTLKIHKTTRHVDLLGIWVDWMRWSDVFEAGRNDYTYLESSSRGQFLFDFAANGRLIRCVLDPRDYESTRQHLKCYYLEEGGYWRSAATYMTFPAFLTWCKIRYLPEIDFSSDYQENEAVMEKYFQDETVRHTIATINEEKFYREWIKDHGILGVEEEFTARYCGIMWRVLRSQEKFP